MKPDLIDTKNMIRAVALDDEPLPLEVIDRFCKEFDFLRLEGTFTQTRAARRYLEDHSIDLLFLDIQMPSMSGIHFYKSLKYAPMVIFTTAYSEYAVDGFDLNAVDYLLKPYDFERFSKAVEKARDYGRIASLSSSSEKSEKFLVVRSEYSLVKINIENIVFVEGLADYLRLHLKVGKSVVTRMTLKDMESELPDDFMRVHRSFIVSVKGIISVRHHMVRIANRDIPIGKTYRKIFYKKFKEVL